MSTYECGFPTCDHPATTEQGMCDYHRNVRVSASWRPSEREEGDW